VHLLPCTSSDVQQLPWLAFPGESVPVTPATAPPVPVHRQRTVQLGGVQLASPFAQAALSGYSDWPMRLMARRLGASYALCEVMLDEFLVAFKDRPRNRHLLYLSDEERPVGGQLMGAKPAQFSAGARRLVQAGFDVIDINFGCPVRKVLGRCRGGFHLGQPDMAIDIIRRTREAVPASIPLTVKMRRGLDDTPESRDKFFRILDAAWAAGVSAVTVHGRTVAQRYIGPSNWEFLAEVKRQAGDRVILGSGDLFSAEDCLAMLRQTGVDGVSIARGAIGNPWIFSQALALAAGDPLPDPPTLFEQRAVMHEHYRLAERIYEEQRCGVLMRKFGIKYAALHPRFPEVRAAFTQVRGREDWDRVLAQWYAEDLPGRYPDPSVHKVNQDCG
jgi:tRNA-dihydrouridine synthase B